MSERIEAALEVYCNGARIGETLRDFISRVLAAALLPLRAREEIAREVSKIVDEPLGDGALAACDYMGDEAADDLRKAITRALSRTAGQEWQEISSAPKDEQRILGTDGVSRFVMFWRGANHLPHQDKPGWNLSGGVQRLFPTHWMPLPAPPVTEPSS